MTRASGQFEWGVCRHTTLPSHPQSATNSQPGISLCPEASNACWPPTHPAGPAMESPHQQQQCLLSFEINRSTLPNLPHPSSPTLWFHRQLGFCPLSSLGPLNPTGPLGQLRKLAAFLSSMPQGTIQHLKWGENCFAYRRCPIHVS